MTSQRWKSPLEHAGLLRRITTRWLRGEGLPADLYLPGDTVIVDPRRAIRPGEIVVAETIGRADPDGGPPRPGVREAIYFHMPGAAAIRFVSPNPGAVSLQVPAADLVVVGIVIGLRRAL